MTPAGPNFVTLENGDRMSREEFLWRWEQIPELKHAELIDGVVHLASPVSLVHGRFENLLSRWLTYYTDSVDGLEFVSNVTCLLGNQSLQPDLALLRVDQSREPKFIESVPELVIEIANFSRSYDVGPKLAAYRSTGVPEYLAVLVEEQRVEWRVLDGGRYLLLAPVDGLLQSPRLKGLRLDPGAVFPPDIKRLKAALH